MSIIMVKHRLAPAAGVGAGAIRRSGAPVTVGAVACRAPNNDLTSHLVDMYILVVFHLHIIKLGRSSEWKFTIAAHWAVSSLSPRR